MTVVWVIPGQTPKKFFNGGRVRVLIDDVYAYIVRIKINPGEQLGRAVIQSRAQEKIPENLSETIWDFVVRKSGVEVVAIVKSFADDLRKRGYDVEAIEPVSYALARLVDQGMSVVLVYASERPLLVAVEDGEIVATEVVAGVLSQAKFADFVNFVNDKFSKPMSKVLVSGEIGWEIKVGEGVVVEKKKLDPVEGIKLKADLGKSDADSLKLELPAKKSKSGLRYYLILVFLMMSAVAIGIGGAKMINKKISGKTAGGLVPTTAPILISPTVAVEMKKDYTIEIQNGSGRSGEAKALALELEEVLGIEIGGVGNAESKSEITKILYKQTVDSQFVASIDKELQKKYTVIKQAQSGDGLSADLIIIIGEK